MKRPFGVTIAAVVLMLSGLVQLLTGAEAMGWLRILNAPAGGESAGVGLLVAGLVTLLVGLGLFSTAGWAWLLTVVVLVIRIVADIWAIVSHGIGSPLGMASIVNLVISAVILWYFMRPSVRAAFGR